MNNDGPNHPRNTWQHRGQTRPAGALVPGPGQESVWDYPRPPVIVADNRLIEVKLNNTLIATTHAAKRVLETASPPTFYLPRDSVQLDCLQPDTGTSRCEWKGQASYFSVCVGQQCVHKAAWSYPEPLAAFTAIRNYLAFYPNRLDCYVDGEPVRAQAGGFYGGWITAGIVGPFKGESGTLGW